MYRIIVAAVLAIVPSMAGALESSQGPLDVQPVVSGLNEPWSFGFLPSGGLLITERGGRLLHVEQSEVHSIGGIPEVAAEGQGGLLDVLVPSDFAESREIFMTFAAPQGRGSGTAVARGRLPEGADRLEDVRTIFEIASGSSSGRHFGSRLVEGPDGYLYVTVGDRGDRPSAQDRSNHNGTVLRITRDGSPAPGNPFLGQDGIRPEIWSFGHRNPQGMALDAAGRIWTAEHGARGGDEINRIERGANFGWPVISYGRHYSGARIGEGTARPGMEQPAFYWDPSIAPSGLMIYSGRLWRDWAGDFFVGSLNSDLISRLENDGSLREAERIEGPETARVRDIREAPDGSIWFLSVGNGALYRITPG